MKIAMKIPVLITSLCTYILFVYLLPSVPYDSLFGVSYMLIGTFLMFPYYLAHEVIASLERQLPYETALIVISGTCIALSIDFAFHSMSLLVKHYRNSEGN